MPSLPHFIVSSLSVTLYFHVINDSWLDAQAKQFTETNPSSVQAYLYYSGNVPCRSTASCKYSRKGICN